MQNWILKKLPDKEMLLNSIFCDRISEADI